MENPDSVTCRIVFYNVENLFYPVDDSLTRDDDFTPEGSYHWSWYRYRKKLNSIAKVIVAIGEDLRPALIGLCEVENRRVLEDLCKKTILQNAGYKIIHQESKDPRGIDVALLYDPLVFTPEDYKAVPVLLNDGTILKTRDILRVTGHFPGDVRCHFIVNHWPSRRGGKSVSEKRRIRAAISLRSEIEKIRMDEPAANVIIMGDFNDEPEDISIKNTLGATFPPQDNAQDTTFLYNMMALYYKLGLGSHYMKHNFYEAGILDQFIVSFPLVFHSNGAKVKEITGHIFRQKFLMNEKNGVPFRTFQGLKYLGGISDHFPVYLDLIIYFH
jgi:hypothetical protein